MRSATKVCLFCSFAVASFSAPAQDFDPLDEANSDVILEKHEKSQSLPDGLAFLNVLHSIRAHTEVGLDPVHYVQSKMEVDEQDAQKIVQYMQATLVDLENETNKLSREVACPTDRPLARGRDVYPILNSLDSVAERIAAVQLILFRAKIGPRNLASLQRLMDEGKKNATYIKFDHEKLFEKSGRNPDEELISLCSQIPLPTGE